MTAAAAASGEAAAAAQVGDGGRADAEVYTGICHPLAVEEWLASRVLEHVADAREICRLALVSRNFREASVSDLVWLRRLPPKRLLDAILNASTSLHSSPLLRKRDLYMRLCKSIPYDNQLKKFWLDPTSGGDCYMISARGLSLIWVDSPQYWKWQPWPGAMFQEVAYLGSVCWFDIHGTFRQILRPGKYLVSFRMQLKKPEASWRAIPIRLCLENISYAHPPHLSEVLFEDTATFKRRFCPLPESMPLAESGHEIDQLHTEWIECDVGEFLVEDDNGGLPAEVEFSMKEMEVLWWKGGFVLDGAIIRPSFVAEKVTIE